MAPRKLEYLFNFSDGITMPSVNPIWLLPVVAVLAAVCWSLTRPAKPTMDPPIAPQTVPFIGHLLGMLLYKGDYMKTLSARYLSWPLFTLNVLGVNIYVVSSPELATALLCNTKSLSFYPFHIAFTNRALGARQEIKDIVAENGADNRYMRAIHNEMYSSLALGSSLLETNKRLINSLAGFLNEFDTAGKEVALFDWMKTAYTLGLAESFYGPRNPIKSNPSFVEKIWDFEEGLPTLFANIFPSITARKAYNARKELAPAFLEYYNQGHDKDANAFIQGRAKAARVEGFTNADIAGFEITICFASLTNTVPNAFSMLCHIFADPVLVTEIAEEVRSVTTQSKVDGIDQIAIDVTAVNGKCPLLVSVFQETIRTCVNATPVRVVNEDMVLKDTYTLQKGGVIQVIGGSIHDSRKIWGDDADTFNPYRFMKKDGLTREQKKAQTSGLLPFGGGKHLCPGRHLAFTEIVSFVAMMVLGFEMRMKDGGLVKLPRYKTQQLGENSKKPVHDINVCIRRKEEYRDAVFVFDIDTTASTTKFSPV